MNVLDIRHGTDIEGTIAGIRNNIHIKGYNFWLLIASAMIASLGLDLNSPAVIIGAMLISPLMSPILGIGLAIGTVDRDMILHSLRNLAMAVGVSFAASVVYFLITPLGQPQPEMFARIEPTLLDVAVAFFGGVAGIVAGSRFEKTNALPGVAIATALMPPLCVSGFGFATGRYEFFFGAFYLFFLNAVFISLSTFFVVRLLHFPRVHYLEPGLERRLTKWMGIAVFLILVPSMYLMYLVITDIRTKTNIEHFLNTYVESRSSKVIRYENIVTDTAKVLRVFLVGEYIAPHERDSLNQMMASNDLEHYKLEFIQINLPAEEREAFVNEFSGRIVRLMEANVRLTDSLARKVDRIEADARALFSDSLRFRELETTLPRYFPAIRYLAFAYARESEMIAADLPNIARNDSIAESERAALRRVVLIDWKRTRSTRDYERRLREIIQIKFGNDSMLVVPLHQVN